MSSIDIGAAAIDRNNNFNPTRTSINLDNPANASGTINTIKVWAYTSMTGLRVGTFYLVSGGTYKCRDSATIGNVTAGSEQTFAGLSIAVEAGDYIGCYYPSGVIELSDSGGAGVYRISGEYIDPDDQASYDFYAGFVISLYGIGETTIYPTVITQAATDVQSTTARPNGQISNDGGEACQYMFRYKKSGGSYNYTTWTGAKTTGQTFYEDINGLSKGSVYYFNARAKNPTGEGAWGSELSFTTEVGIPDPPTNVVATNGTYGDKVRITWTKSTGATGYQVYRDGIALGWLGDVVTYDDTGADAPTITPGDAVASDGAYADKVALSLSGSSANKGTTHTYKVKAKNEYGESADSATNTGYRLVSLTYQWQRSAGDSDASYTNIIGATSANYNDTGAPADGSGRYYKCAIDGTGAAPQTSGANRGYRITMSTVTTQAVDDIQAAQADGHGNITSTGGEDCDTRGVCWNTAGAPTVADDHAEDNGAGSYSTGPFTKTMTSLTLGTKHYVRAYAHNSAGYSYGNQVEFTTLGYISPVTIGDVIDCTALIDTYDRIEWTEDLPSADQDIVVSIRSSPDNATWTEWEAIYSSPCTSFTTIPQRYLEWKAVLTTTDKSKYATLSDISFYWSKTAV